MATPKIIPYEVQLRSTKIKRNITRPVVYTNDLRSAEFQFQIIDMQPGELTGATATTLLYMRDGSFFQNPKEDVILAGTTFSYLLKENEGNHAGVSQIQLVVKIGDAEFASQLFDFEVINGLDSKVAQEIMIHDWTTLTREARAYIDEFAANEILREAEFDNNEFDRNAAFVVSQDARTLAFGTEQTNRGTAFTAEQNERTTAFNESESGRTTAETGRVTAESNRVTAESGRVTKESQRVTAESSRVTAESGRVTAESGRVTAESGRVTAETNRAAAFTAFNTRLTAEETATANNKISAVKGKTFADVDGRFEDVEADTTLMGTNIITNGDFSNGTIGWNWASVTPSVSNNKIRIVAAVGVGGEHFLVQKPVAGTIIQGRKYYIRGVVDSLINATLRFIVFNRKADGVYENTPDTAYTASGPRSLIFTPTSLDTIPDTQIRFQLRAVPDAVSFVANGNEELSVSYVQCIDLTATFGAGKEPTVEQMDEIMAKFPHSWFNGTANLFRANATLNKLMAVDARTEFDVKNAVVNGDFSNGTTGWASNLNSSTLAALNNTLIVTGSGGDGSVRTVTNTSVMYEAGKKLYIRIKGRVRDSLSYSLKFSLRNSLTNSTTNEFYNVSNPVVDTWYQPSAIVSLGQTLSGQNVTVYVQAVYLDAATASGKIVELKDVIIIDLTAAFGAGKEPTLAEMDRLMARFPNSWFDGVKPIQTIETLYQEKANKVQESWITPTLQNGWAQFGTDAVGYMKDEMGFVHLKGAVYNGTVGQVALTLPVGYRPKNENNRIAVVSNGVFGRITISSAGLVTMSQVSNAWVSLDNIVFRAEG